jgi:hypothetical protein
MFTAVLFTIVKRYKQMPGILFSQEKEILSHATVYMKVEDILQSERKKRQ